MLKRKSNGSVDAFIMLMIGVFFICLLTITIIGYLQPIIKYINLNQLVRRYTLKMETDGGLTSSAHNNLRTDLTNSGYNLANVTIISSPAAGTTASYGSDISLDISYNCPIKYRTVNGLKAQDTSSTILIHIKKTTVSKRAP